jgi:two-component system OmpR family sensor kinase
MIDSLRGRLFIGLTVTVAVAAAGLFAFRYAYDEAIEGQDATLTQVGALAVEGHFDQHMTPSSGIDPENRLVIETLPARTPSASSGAILDEVDDGLRDVSRGSERWRVLIRTRTDGSRVMVGQPTSVREEIATGSALRTIVPLATLIPVMMLVMVFLVGQSLRPIKALAAKLDARKAEDLEELPPDHVPRELQPFIGSINRLLQRIHVLVDRQRRFIADAAHELRTPIAALMLQAENLDQVELPSESSERLEALRLGVRRTKRLLEQLLALARYDADQGLPRPTISLDKSAREVVADLLPESNQKGIDLGFDHLDSCGVAAEPVMVEVLLRNLLDNALRHTPPGGRIDISLRSRKANAILAIADTGPGIPSDDIDRIFEPFFRGSQHQGDGSGRGCQSSSGSSIALTAP